LGNDEDFVDCTKYEPSVDTNTPDTMPSREIPSLRLTVSTPKATATIALVIGSDALNIGRRKNVSGMRRQVYQLE
jgi:hypothetical protein